MIKRDNLEFVESIQFESVDDRIEYIIKYFDRLMALGNLIGHCEYKSITPNKNEAEFDIVLQDIESANKFFDSLDFCNVTVTMYDSTYYISDKSIYDNVVRIILSC